jgi:Zn-dependent protease
VLGSFKIGSVLGITVRVHWLFAALIAFVLWMPDDGAMTRGDKAVYLALLFGVVFLHELGHSLVARRYGIRIFDITFWPLGGMARMSEIPETPRVEMWIAAAGPLVNFVLALLTLPVWVWSWMAAGELGAAPWIDTLASLSGTFLAINLLLGTFNLLPAFPMDGGRILRAFLGRTRDWVRATELAVKVGRVLAVLMVVVGIVFSRGAMMLPLVGLFVWFAGARELWAVRMRHGRLPFGPLAGQPFAPQAAPGEAPPWDASARGAPPRNGGVSQSDIERLERFGGSLRQYRARGDAGEA